MTRDPSDQCSRQRHRTSLAGTDLHTNRQFPRDPTRQTPKRKTLPVNTATRREQKTMLAHIAAKCRTAHGQANKRAEGERGGSTAHNAKAC